MDPKGREKWVWWTSRDCHIILSVWCLYILIIKFLFFLTLVWVGFYYLYLNALDVFITAIFKIEEIKTDSFIFSGKLGRFPPMMHHHQAPLDGQTPTARAQRSHLAEAFAKAKGSGGGTGGAGGGGGSGRGLMGQIIPIYGFGIFLYILYILFKVSGIILILLYQWQCNTIIIKIIVSIKTVYSS